MEIFDVVNEQDEVVGLAPRAEVHRLGLRHRATHILLRNGRGEWFLQQRSLTKDMWPGVWDSSASGHVDHGESYDDCARREIQEELGLASATVTPVRWFRLDACPETGMEFCWVYLAGHEGPFQLQESEIRGGGWFHADTIHRWMQSRPEDFASAFRILWQRIHSDPALMDRVAGS
jgi:isopentenyldiphosphate isomerase